MKALIEKKTVQVGAGTVTLVGLNALERLEYFEYMYSLDELPDLDSVETDREKFALGYKLQRRTLFLNARFLAYGLKEHWPEMELDQRATHAIAEFSDTSVNGTETIMHLISELESLSGLKPPEESEVSESEDLEEPVPAKKG